MLESKMCRKQQGIIQFLFLCDRNILAEHTKTNGFNPFGAAMTKITNRQVAKSFEIYLSLYQTVSGADDADSVGRNRGRVPYALASRT